MTVKMIDAATRRANCLKVVQGMRTRPTVLMRINGKVLTAYAIISGSGGFVRFKVRAHRKVVIDTASLETAATYLQSNTADNSERKS